jgi:Flp pilus assembly protein TadB
MMPMLLAGAAAAAVFLLATGLLGGGRRSSSSSRRMNAVLNTAADAEARSAKGSRRNAMGELGKKRISALKSQRRNANYKALGIAGLCGIVTAVVGWTILDWLGALAGLGLGFMLPTIVRSQMQRRRRSKINDSLPDLLQTLAGGLRAGQTFIQTLDSAAEEMGEPFKTELQRSLRELELGVSVEDSFEGLRERLDDDDFDLVVDAVLIQRRVGGNLAEVLTNIAHTIRERIRIRGEVNSLTGQARLSGWVLSALPVAVGVLVYFMNPDYMTPMLTHPMGIAALVGAGFSELIGMLIIRKIADVKV